MTQADSPLAKPHEVAVRAAITRARRRLIPRERGETYAEAVCEALAGPDGPFDAAVLAWTDEHGLTLPMAAVGVEGQALMLLVCEALADDRLATKGCAGSDCGSPIPPAVERQGFAWLGVLPVPAHDGGWGRLGVLSRAPWPSNGWRGALGELTEDLAVALVRAAEDERDAAERARLRERSERLQAVLDVAPAAINLNRVHDGRYAEVSQGFLDITGYTREQILGRTSLELGIWQDPSDRDEMVARLQRDGKITDYVAPFVDARGRVLMGSLSARVQDIYGEPYLVSVTLDVTARERALRALRGLIESHPDAVLVLDAHAPEPTRAVLFANPAGHRLRGELGDDVLRDWLQATGDATAESPGNPVEWTEKTSERFPRTYSVERASLPWGEREAVLLAARDVSARAFQTRALAGVHTLTAELLQADEFALGEGAIRRFAEAMNARAVWWFDAQDPARSVAWGDPRTARLAPRMRGANPPPCVGALRDGEAGETLQGGQLPFCATCPAKPSARFASLVRLVWDGEDLVGALGIQHPWADVDDAGFEHVLRVAVDALQHAARTQRARRRERVAETRAREAERLEALGRLAGGVAHDFNNLLTVILGSARFLERTAALTSEQLQDLHSIRDAGNRAAALTSKLLAYGRRQPMRRTVFDCNERLEALRELIERLVGEDIDFRVEGSPTPLPVFADAREVERAVMNLVTNARAAMPEGGRLLLTLSQAELSEEDLRALQEDPMCVVSSAAKPGRFAALVVADTGHGIERENLRRIFEPFFTTREVGEGTGLGLSMVEGIVHQSGGFVTVYSRPGVGTRVALHIPLGGVEEEDEPQWDAAKGRGAAPPPRRGRELAAEGVSILVVEDDDKIRGVIRRVLKDAGYRVRDARGLREAAAALRDGAPVTLLIADVVMPGGSGVDVAKLVRGRHPEAKILYTSGYPRAELQRRGALSGDAGLLQKPFMPDELREKVDSILSG